MADEDDKSGSNGGGSGPGGGALTPYLPPMPAPWFPASYAPPMYQPLPPAADKSELRLSDSTPAQVRAELGWLVSTVKQNRMPIGVLVTCHRLLLLILHDLEARYRTGRSSWWGNCTVHKRLKALQKAGAITRAVVDEAQLIKLEPYYRAYDYNALLGDPSEATRYVHFLRMLVEVAYEAQAKYRKAQQPAAKSNQGMAMTVTVGPQGGSS